MKFNKKDALRERGGDQDDIIVIEAITNEPEEHYVIRYTKTQSLEIISAVELEEDYELIAQEPTHWRADRGGEYWSIDGIRGNIISWYDIRGTIPNAHYENYNYFRTIDEAERVSEIQRALRVLLNDCTGTDDGIYWSVKYNYDGNLYTAKFGHFGTLAINPFRFKTEEDAERSIKLHEKEWKIFLGVEE